MSATKLQTHLLAHNLQVCSQCEHESVIEGGKPLCGLTGEEIGFFRDGYACPAGKFTVRMPGRFARVASLVKSLTSGRASEAVIEERRRQCAACPKLVRDEHGEYCGACGCPRTKVSELSTKLAFAYVECPLAKPGFSNHRPVAEGEPC